MNLFRPHKRLKPFFIGIGITCWLAAIVVVIVPVFPYFLYRLSPGIPSQLAKNIASTVSANQPINQSTNQPSLPPLDSSLPTTNMLNIPSIGVNGAIHQGTDSEAQLREGIWMVPEFASPDDGMHPIILASHRWGYLDWSNSFRKLNSFYSLPKTEVGDQVQIVWDQRLYTYEIYNTENSDHITDYSADLILYTCELWNSPLRVFRYLKRI